MDDIKVDFPLKGIWQVVTSSIGHNTDKLAMSHAFSFAKSEDINRSLFDKFKTSDTQRSIGWKQDVFSPCAGKIVRMVSSQKDRHELKFFKDFMSGYRVNKFDKNSNDFHVVFGNYIIIESDGYFCLLAHLKEGSMQFEVGNEIKVGEKLAEIGHNGRSKIPQLHMQLMDSADLKTAKGLPVCFDIKAEARRQWNVIEYCVPARGVRIKSLN